jgi:hypothetical protein
MQFIKTPVACLLLSACCFTADVAAQAAAPTLQFPAASQAASVKQRVGVTDIEITYHRPNVSGRAIFGSLVPYGMVWRTGANNATRISFSTAVKFGGADVPPGTYALFTIPGPDEWTIILGKGTEQWGAYSYDKKNDVVRVTTKPQQRPQAVESFTIAFAQVEREAVQLELAWDRVAVPVRIAVDVKSVLVPQIEATMASAQTKKPYYQAAEFYFENDIDLKKAVTWIGLANAAQPKNLFLLHRKAVMLAKVGDKASALTAATESLELAKKETSPDVRDEYVRLNNELISRLR